MAKKTNKTSHVLNLITNGSTPEPEETAEENQDEKAAGEDAAGETSAKGSAAREKTPKGAVTKDTESGKKTPETAVKEPTQRLTASGDKTVIVVDETSQNANVSNKILDRLTDQLEEEIQGKFERYHMVNVMEQILKRMNLERFMEQYDVCMCSRCQADVLALILTRLPAKYVVVDESSTAPIIGFYESKFRVRILTEIIKACMDVKANPRHDNALSYDK